MKQEMPTKSPPVRDLLRVTPGKSTRQTQPSRTINCNFKSNSINELHGLITSNLSLDHGQKEALSTPTTSPLPSLNAAAEFTS